MTPNGKKGHILTWSNDAADMCIHSRSKKCEVRVTHYPPNADGTRGMPLPPKMYTGDAQGDVVVPLARGWHVMEFNDGQPKGDVLVDLAPGTLAMKGDPDPWPPPPPPPG